MKLQGSRPHLPAFCHLQHLKRQQAGAGGQLALQLPAYIASSQAAHACAALPNCVYSTAHHKHSTAHGTAQRSTVHYIIELIARSASARVSWYQRAPSTQLMLR